MFASGGFLGVLEDQIQIAALLFMATMYAIKVVMLFRLKAATERTPARGDPGAGIRYSFMTIAMPWAVLSARQHIGRYVEFVVFHVGVAFAITYTFLIPYVDGIVSPGAHGLWTSGVLAMLAAATVVGVIRLVRRIVLPELRIISTPDDYFSVGILTVYLASAFLCLWLFTEWSRYLFFGMTTFFLVYVPFSKISHYLLWPFARYYLGKHWGRRGVYPKRPSGTTVGVA